MFGLKKFLASLTDLEEQPIEPELKTTANKDRDREIKYVYVVESRNWRAMSEHQDRNKQLTAIYALNLLQGAAGLEGRRSLTSSHSARRR